MDYTKRRATLKWCYRNTKKIKYCSSAKFDEHYNKFGKGCSPVSEIMTGTYFPLFQH